MTFVPGYAGYFEDGILEERVLRLREMLRNCTLCGHRCGVNRLEGELGRCGAGGGLEVSSSCVHRGEEPVLTGDAGVGNVFLERCNLSCVYCQNHTISQPSECSRPGRRMSAEDLSDVLLDFQGRGCPTAGFVSPTHFAPQIMEAVMVAASRGFRLPIIYNTGGYDSIELLRELEGLVDIYLPDFKYWESDCSEKYSGAPDYPRVAMSALKEMQRQVGNLRMAPSGAARRGLLVRLLVLPGGISGTEDVLRFIAEKLGTDVFISLMSQYYPAHNAACFPPLDRSLAPEEYSRAVEVMEELGFENGWIQDPVTSPDSYRPGVDFDL